MRALGLQEASSSAEQLWNPRGCADLRRQDVNTSISSKNKLKEIIKLLDHRIQVLHQKNLMHEHEPSEKQDRSLTVHMSVVKGSSVKVKATPSSLTTQEIPFSNSYTVLIGYKLHKISPNILVDTPVRPNNVKGAGTEEDITLLPALKQDKDAGNNGGRSLRKANITVRFLSADNSSRTEIDIYNLNDPREVPEVHVIASNIMNQGIKTDTVVLKGNGLQVVVNSSVDNNAKHIPEKGRRTALIVPVHGKTTADGSKRNHPFTVPESLAYQLLLLIQPLPPLKTTSALKDEGSQSIMTTKIETSVEELENILTDLKMERGMYFLPSIILKNFILKLKISRALIKLYLKQETPSTNEKLQSSVMEDILQELQDHLAEVRRPSTSDREEPMLMDNIYSSNELEDPEEAGYSEENHNMLTEPIPEETDFPPFPDEPPLIPALEASSVPNLVTEVTNEHMNDAQRYEFFEKYEGIHGRKKSKAADLKDLLKHIIIACVAVTCLILTVIVVVHIYTSLFVKKEQEPDKTNADKKGGPDNNEVTSAEKTRSQQPHYNVGIEGAQNQQLEYAVNIAKTGSQQPEDSTVGIDNQNNNNLSSPPEMFSSTDTDYIKKPLDLHPDILSPSSPPEDTGLLLPVEPSRHTAHNSLPSYNSSTSKNLKVQPRTFRIHHSSYNSLGNYGKSKDHDYKRLQAKDTVCYKTKPICQRPSRHRPKSTEPKRGHKKVSAKQHSYSSSSWVGDPSSNVPAALDTNKNSKESRLSQDDDSDCACFQHIKGSSSTDSYSN
ncbi:uncharacterized protein LOC118085752 [Zootoca vivipara]|uniref:uncharacterized protein LOC118085752 n=1 Tax=Zootoca vivipara TaxID=8524 RepID=UPI00293BA38A|nr:uncharacterized protein LOC118085752 [Zootoca vivipara]